jgi:hypothetical protein
MRRLISLGAVVAVLCGVLAVVAGSASAVDFGRKCAPVTIKGTGRYTEKNCATVSGTMEGEFLVEEAIKKGFKISSGKSVLTAPKAGIVIVCEKDKGTGKILTDIKTESKILFEGCVVITGGKECKFGKIGAETGEISTELLEGQNGTIAVGEATSKMGGFFKPKVGSVFTKIPESEACKTPPISVEGSIVCEGAAQTASVTGEVTCETVEVEKVLSQKAKKIGVLEEGAKGKEVTKEGSLKAAGVAAFLKTKETITYEEALTLFP